MCVNPYSFSFGVSGPILTFLNFMPRLVVVVLNMPSNGWPVGDASLQVIVGTVQISCPPNVAGRTRDATHDPVKNDWNTNVFVIPK